jgi:hypothetical protein
MSREAEHIWYPTCAQAGNGQFPVWSRILVVKEVKTMRRDKQLVDEFLSAYSLTQGSVYSVLRRPEEENRRMKAVEVVASNTSGDTIAVEHTLLEPFEGERADNVRFDEVFGPLEGSRDLRKPGYNVDIRTDFGVIPTGVKWNEVGELVRRKVSESAQRLCEGETTESIQELPFDLRVTFTITAHNEGQPDYVTISRNRPANSLKEIVQRAFTHKLPKLVTETARRILLLEKADHVHGYTAIHKTIDDIAPEFGDFKKLDEIWLVNSSIWESEGLLSFLELFPTCGGRQRNLQSLRDGK